MLGVKGDGEICKGMQADPTPVETRFCGRWRRRGCYGSGLNLQCGDYCVQCSLPCVVTGDAARMGNQIVAEETVAAKRASSAIPLGGKLLGCMSVTIPARD